MTEFYTKDLDSRGSLSADLIGEGVRLTLRDVGLGPKGVSLNMPKEDLYAIVDALRAKEAAEAATAVAVEEKWEVVPLSKLKVNDKVRLTSSSGSVVGDVIITDVSGINGSPSVRDSVSGWTTQTDMDNGWKYERKVVDTPKPVTGWVAATALELTHTVRYRDRVRVLTLDGHLILEGYVNGWGAQGDVVYSMGFKDHLEPDRHIFLSDTDLSEYRYERFIPDAGK